LEDPRASVLCLLLQLRHGAFFITIKNCMQKACHLTRHDAVAASLISLTNLCKKQLAAQGQSARQHMVTAAHDHYTSGTKQTAADCDES